MNFLSLALDTTTTGANPNSPLNGAFSIIMLVVMVVVFYFFIMRPQKKKQKEEEKMRNNLQVGDEIITIGGIHGKIVSLKEDSFVLESTIDRCKLKFERWAIQQNLTVHDEEK